MEPLPERRTDFCKFCGEPHKRASSTCSNECTLELIEHEFANCGDAERACIYCPSRGDSRPFKSNNTCESCADSRLKHGACNRCGGPTRVYGCCPNCEPHHSIFRLKPDGSIAQTTLLLDPETYRARRIYSPSPTLPTGVHVKVAKDRRKFEAGKGLDQLTIFEFKLPILDNVDGLGGLETRIRVLEVYLEVGNHFTMSKWLAANTRLNGSTSEAASTRYFERWKKTLKEWGITHSQAEDTKEEYEPNSYVYDVDQQAIGVIHRYYLTCWRNIQLGYYWK